MKNHHLIALLLSVFIAFLGIGIIIPIMPVFATELGAGGFALGMIIAAFSITRGVLMPVIGNFSDKWGRKNFLASGLLIYGLVGLLIPEAENVGQLITIRSFHGVGSAMIVPIAMAYLSVLAPAGQEGRYMSYLNISIFCGIGCGPIIGGAIYDTLDFAAVFHLMAVMSFLAFILVAATMPPQTSSGKDRRTPLIQSFKNMAANAKTSGILLARFGTMIIMVPTMAFLPLIMSSWQDTSGLQIGIVIAARTLVNALLQVPFGKLSDRYNKLIILITSSICLALTVMCIPWMADFTSMLTLYILLGAEEAAVWAVLGAYASIEAKERYGHGTMMGVFSLAMSGGVFTGAVFSGTTMDILGTHAAYAIASLTVIIISLTSVTMIYRYELKLR
ncbi:MAG: MFS transporter [Desulfocapsaceae bacterium]|nr:MFS transporter [Desulfocapsaceae bacterium]